MTSLKATFQVVVKQGTGEQRVSFSSIEMKPSKCLLVKTLPSWAGYRNLMS